MQWPRWRPGRLARRTVNSTLWLFVRALLLGPYLILSARALSPEGYGLLTAAVSLCVMVTPLSGLGMEVLILKYTSKDKQSLPRYAGKFLHAWSSSGVLLLGLTLVVGTFLFQQPRAWTFLLPVAIAEVVVTPLFVALVHGLQALEQLTRATRFEALLALMRLLAAVVFWLTPLNSVSQFCWLYLGAASLTLLVAGFSSREIFSGALRAVPVDAADLRQATPFAMLMFVTRARGNIDRPILLVLGGQAAVGIYSAAVRLAEVASLPLVAMVRAAAPRLFRIPGVDAGPSVRLSPLLLATVLYGSGAALVMIVVSPWVPVLLGPGFEAASRVVVWLALLPTANGLYQLMQTRLVAAGLTSRQLLVETSSIAVAVVLFIWLIPRFGLAGAVGALLGSYAATILASGLIVLSQPRKRGSSRANGTTTG